MKYIYYYAICFYVYSYYINFLFMQFDKQLLINTIKEQIKMAKSNFYNKEHITNGASSGNRTRAIRSEA